MIDAQVKIKLDTQGVKQQIAEKMQRAQYALDQRVAADSNFYCPEDVGDLHDSVMPSAAEGRGRLVWTQIYARAQYYFFPRKSEDKNPNARTKWFEHAKRRCSKSWQKAAQNGFNK